MWRAAERVPWSIPLLAGTLMSFGCLGLLRCEELSETAAHYLRQQWLWAALGCFCAALSMLPSYRLLSRLSYAAFVFTLVLLAAVYFSPRINGAHRWIRVGPIGFQPSELAKLTYLLALSRFLMYGKNYRRLRGLIAPLLLTALPVLLILKEPDLGTAAIFLPLFFFMLWIAGARRSDLLALVLAGAALLPLAWTQMSPYQKARVSVLLHPPQPGQTPSAQSYQIHQARQVMALGGPWGSLLGKPPIDDLALYRLPEGHTDFILCVITERYGLIGLAIVLVLFGLLVSRIMRVAVETREPWGRLFCSGVAGLIAIEVLVNVGVTLGLLPITGLPLPLVSYGGSGLVVHLVALGVVINVAIRPGYEVTNEPFRYAIS
jgi:cell division protein FtsW (lipid II flippase)